MRYIVLFIAVITGDLKGMVPLNTIAVAQFNMQTAAAITVAHGMRHIISRSVIARAAGESVALVENGRAPMMPAVGVIAQGGLASQSIVSRLHRLVSARWYDPLRYYEFPSVSQQLLQILQQQTNSGEIGYISPVQRLVRDGVIGGVCCGGASVVAERIARAIGIHDTNVRELLRDNTTWELLLGMGSSWRHYELLISVAAAKGTQVLCEKLHVTDDTLVAQFKDPQVWRLLLLLGSIATVYVSQAS